MHRREGEVMSLVLQMLPSSNYSLCEVPPHCHLILSLSVAGLTFLFSTAKVNAVELFNATCDSTKLQNTVFQSSLFLIEEHLVIFLCRNCSLPLIVISVLLCAISAYTELLWGEGQNCMQYQTVLLLCDDDWFFFPILFFFFLFWDNVYLELLHVTDCPL